MQVGAGRATGHPDRTDARSGGDALSRLHVDGAQMAVHADETAAVIDEHRIAVEKIVARIEHRSGDRQHTGVPEGAAMSMPVCGLRDSPLKMRRMPNELLRAPGTGGGKRSVSGGGFAPMARAPIDAHSFAVDAGEVGGR